MLLSHGSTLVLLLLSSLDLSLLHRGRHLHVFDLLFRQVTLIDRTGILHPSKLLSLCLCLSLSMSCLNLLLVSWVNSWLGRSKLLFGNVNSSHLHEHVVEDGFVTTSLGVELSNQINIGFREGLVRFNNTRVELIG